MISLVIAVMMIAQMLTPADRRPAGDRVRLARDLLPHHRGVAGRLRSASRLRCRRPAATAPRRSGFRGDVGSLIRSRAFIGYVLCQVLASQIIFTFAGGGPYIVVTQMGRTSAEYGAWFATTGIRLSGRQPASACASRRVIRWRS